MESFYEEMLGTKDTKQNFFPLKNSLNKLSFAFGDRRHICIKTHAVGLAVLKDFPVILSKYNGSR